MKDNNIYFEVLNDSRSTTYHYPILARIALKHFDMPINSQCTLIDAGCGEGKYTECFRRNGFRTIGIDINPEWIEKAKKQFSQNIFLCCDLNKRLPFEDSSFDYLFSNSVLQYLDWKNVIQEYKRILKHSGKALFVENLYDSPLAKANRIIRKFPRCGYGKFLTPRRHIRYGEIEEFKKYFSDVKFDFFDLTKPLSYTPRYLANLLMKKTIRSSAWLPKKLNKLDRFLLDNFPILKKYCWQIIIMISK